MQSLRASFRSFSRPLMVAIAACAVAMSQPAVADAADQTFERPKALIAMEALGKFQVLKEFKTDAEGLDGFIVQDGAGQGIVLYGYKGYLLGGIMMDENGNNLTQSYADQHIPKPDYNEVGARLEKMTTLVGEGDLSKPALYVFADPNCGYCKQFYEATRTMVAAGEIHLRWIMVGFLRENSSNISAAVMDGGASALAQSVAKFGRADAPSVATLTEKHQSALQEHASLMRQFNIAGTPGLVFKNADGIWETREGMPTPEALSGLIKQLGK